MVLVSGKNEKTECHHMLHKLVIIKIYMQKALQTLSVKEAKLVKRSGAIAEESNM